jgi:primosomal protein N' (replication factor Y) (superfamily II helicase)
VYNSTPPAKNDIAGTDEARDLSVAQAYAEVAIPLGVMGTFTYRLPISLKDYAKLGSRVVVPFGRQQITGYIVGLPTSIDSSKIPVESDIKDILELVDSEPLLTQEVFELTRWVSEYYAAPWGEVLKAALPAGLNAKVEKIFCVSPRGREALKEVRRENKPTLRTRALELIATAGELSMRRLARELGSSQAKRIARDLDRDGWITQEFQQGSVVARVKQRKAVRLLPDQLENSQPPKRATTEAQLRILASLAAENGVVGLKELLASASASMSSVQTLEKHGRVEVFYQDVRRDPLGGVKLPKPDEFQLTPAQSDALTEIESSIESAGYAAFLLHGVTGSGKTEIYYRAIRAALAKGRSAIMLVPEISLTPVFSRQLRAYFGDQVAIFHSSLTIGERFDEWNRLRRGEAKVVFGTRLSVFAPVANLGLVVIDEEHETSYRQQESPFYHGRDTAIMRAHMESAVILLGSATPSLESFHNAKIGKYRYLRLPGRIADRPMAEAEIVDMTKVFTKHGRAVVISDELHNAIESTHGRGEQSIILLNRRGFSSFLLCRSCGESIHCPNCDVTLTYHRSVGSLVCHYCNHRMQPPGHCPLCSGKYIFYVGEGTEQIEEMLRKQFPNLRIARLDHDTTSRGKLFEKTLLAFGAGKLDMLVGTQMLAKGHDFPNVTLVGVVSIDAGLSLPDFRSAERAFQLITQVAGRAGRGELSGRVLIQSYHPQHYAIRHACTQDYEAFYAEEIRYRKNLNYPPFVALASLLVHGWEFKQVMNMADKLRHTLDEANTERVCRILGPAPAPIARLKRKHRVQILIKSHSRPRMREVIDQGLAKASTRGLDMYSIKVEIDPVNLM